MNNGDREMTRVRRVFDTLLDRSEKAPVWVAGLWEMAALTRPDADVPPPSEATALLASEAPAAREARQGTVYQRAVAPPAVFLRWLLDNPQLMEVADPATFGAKGADSRRWRGKLFSGEADLVSDARDEGLRQLGKRLAQRGRKKWWAFEGFSRVDCCLISETAVLFVEGQGAEPASPSTVWFPQRSRLWRNVEAAQELAGDRQFGVMLAVESEADGAAALAHAADTLVGSFPHLEGERRAELSTHLLGFVTWPDVVRTFDVPPDSVV